jgi:hypothetical protein
MSRLAAGDAELLSHAVALSVSIVVQVYTA